MDIETLKSIVNPKAVQVVEGDYVENGLLYCGCCNTPKQISIKWLGKEEKKVACLCECQEKKRNEEEEEYKRNKISIKVDRLRSQGIDSKKYLSMTMENSKKDTTIIKEYIEKWEYTYNNCRNMILMGPVGTGKTYTAAAIVNGLIDRQISACIIDVPYAIANIYDNQYRDRLINNLKHCKLCMWDDIGANRTTEYALEQLYMLVDIRDKSGMPSIYTTNLSIEELKEARNGYITIISQNGQAIKIYSQNCQRIYDRVLSNTQKKAIVGESLRKIKR